HHVVLNIDLHLQTVVLALETFHQKSVFQRDGCHSRDSSEQLQVIFVEAGADVLRVQVNRSQAFLERDQGHGQQGTDLRTDDTLRQIDCCIMKHVVAQQRNLFPDHLVDDGSRNLHGPILGGGVPLVYGSEFVRCFAGQQDCCTIPGNHLKNEPEQLSLERLQSADGRDGRADLQQGFQIPHGPVYPRQVLGPQVESVLCFEHYRCRRHGVAAREFQRQRSHNRLHFVVNKQE